MKKKELILIDSLAILFRSYHAIQNLTNDKGENIGAVYGFLSTLIRILQDRKPEEIIACFDHPDPTLRHELYDGYKASREAPEDDLVKQIEETLIILEKFSIDTISLSGYEADDIIGTLAERYKKEYKILVVTGDSDLLQLVDDDVSVLLLRHGSKSFNVMDEKVVEEKYGFGPEKLIEYKGLCGDSSDDIPGVKGIGAKGATQLIVTYGTLEGAYKALKDPDAMREKGLPNRAINALQGQMDIAKLSRKLGTIIRDVPVEYTLPKIPFKERADIDQITRALTEASFNSFIPRIKKVFSIEEESVDIDPVLLRETQIMFWILNSEKTEAPISVLCEGFSSLGEAHKRYSEKLKEADLWSVWEDIEKPLIKVIERIEGRGIEINIKVLKDIEKTCEVRLKEIEKEVSKHTDKEYNLASPKQVSDLLFVDLGLTHGKKTSTGMFSTREEELEKIKDKHPVVPLILEHREVSKLLKNYATPLQTLLDKDNRIHARFLQDGTTTGRLSSKEPNLQNIPKHTSYGEKVREAFVASSGHTLVAVDYTQMELRVAAILSKDKTLIDLFNRDSDFHQEVAALIYGTEDITSVMRNHAKRLNFGILYGMGIRAIAKSLSVDTKEAEKYLATYKKRFSALTEFLESCKKQAREKGYVTTLLGRKRYIPGIKSRIPQMQALGERVAINTPIQGTGADLIKKAMIGVDAYLEESKVGYLLLQVHDELVFEIQNDKVEEATKKIQTIMEGVLSDSPVPLTTKASLGESWGMLK